MNIHFEDIELFDNLNKMVIFDIEVGAGMYGLKNKDSDIDILKIYLDNTKMLYETNHQLQYNATVNGNKVNYIFTSLEQFIRNILSGDSTINYEVLSTKLFKTHSIAFYNLYHKLSKYKLKIIKSYLGMANRDLKSLRKEFSGKKLSHFIRGVEFAHSLANDRDLFEFVLDYNKRMYLLEIKNNDFVDDSTLETVAIYETRMDTLRAVVDSARVEKLSWEDAALINYIIEDVYKKFHKGVDSLDINMLFCKAIYNDDFGYKAK